jgi:hypothetical protein
VSLDCVYTRSQESETNGRSAGRDDHPDNIQATHSSCKWGEAVNKNE